jgi:hypothetical protein
MTDALETMRETRTMTEAEIACVSGALFTELVSAIADVVADAYAAGAIKAGCLMTPEGGFTACPKTPR